MGKFITRIQAVLQGCIIETPHSDDIRAIVGDAQCPDSSPRTVSGWSDGKNCAGGGLVIISFSKNVIFTEGTAANGVSITHSNGGTYALSGTGATGSGTAEVQYDGNWNVAISPGDVITYGYADADGNYRDEDDVQMGNQSRVVGNCIDPPILLTAVASNATGVNQHIILTFDRPITGDGELGVTWKGLDPGWSNTDPSAQTIISYIVDPGQTLYNDDIVTWSYAKGTGNLKRSDSGVELEDVVDFNVNMTGLDSRPPSTTDGWSTEDGGDWLTEDGGRWLLE